MTYEVLECEFTHVDIVCTRSGLCRIGCGSQNDAVVHVSM